MFGQPGARVVIPVRPFCLGLIAACSLVLLLGYLREAYVAALGLDTPLEDLGQIALDSEQTLASWASSLLLLCAAGLLGLIARLSARGGDRDASRWTLLGLIFVGMAVDEAVSFHEVLIDPMRALFGGGGILFFAWVVPAAIFVVSLGAFLAPFLLRLPRRHAVRFFVCGALYVGGALGMEMVSGASAAASGLDSAAYVLSATAEETMEMAGVVLFCCALAAYAKERWRCLSITLA